MTPAWKAQPGYPAIGDQWKATIPAISPSSHVGDGPRHWAPQPHPTGAALGGPPRRCGPPPPLPLFHTRHAEQSAGRPRLVTVARPCGHSDLRKVTVLLNRRGVVSFEQLLLDVSEALGFPRWHRGRVTRLFTPHGREVRGVSDFFRGEVAFLALGRARPELRSVQEALEELFPEPSRYRADAVRAWERRLRPPPDKAAKADSGYSEETADGDDDRTNPRAPLKPDAQWDAKARPHQGARRTSQPPPHAGKTRRHDHDGPAGCRQPKEKHPCRQPTHPPNHLQALRGKGGTREQQPSGIGLFQADKALRGAHAPSPSLCQNCLAGRNKLLVCSELPDQIPKRVPLPPVSRKPKPSPTKHPKSTRLGAVAPQRGIRDEEEQCLEQLKHSSINSPRGGPPEPEETQRWVPFDLLRDKKEVALSDIERCYDIGRVIGDGNFAIVRECRRRDTGLSLAMKIVERSKLIGREHMMQNELSLLGSLSHPCVVRLFAHYHTHTQAYLVLELVNGGDLFEAIARRGKFPEDEAGLIVADVSGALSYIHSKSIVHRDLKPENLLIECRADGSNRLKLGDFGLAMVVTEPIFTVCGTPTYVAPEILSETGYGLSVDVWALGVILYILLCGFPPFRSQDRDQEELFKLIREGKVHFLSNYWDPVSEGAKDLVKGLLQGNPIERLSASQSLQHPWVQAMATACRQGALTQRLHKTTAALAAAESRDTRGQTSTGKAPRDKRTAHADSQPGLTHKAQISPAAEATEPSGAHRELNPGAPEWREEGSRQADAAEHPAGVDADAAPSERPGSSPTPSTSPPLPPAAPPDSHARSPRSGTMDTAATSPPGAAQDVLQQPQAPGALRPLVLESSLTSKQTQPPTGPTEPSPSSSPTTSP
ncbi:serine/threonine-protein kinase DCLK3 [Gadus macrocephalus]|uniref:serine/threonine-protein kinase DCLK3 n=1 Tax=Gadus macrocephalus TaxID=80720 RepID=UPI0028CB372F|nr:serine/threonine-protein kinase DCLK3 [Gadus macrocephalus]